jgi:hypothetical protein
MNGTCLHCGEHLDTRWAFCPHCAAPRPREGKTGPPPHEKLPVRGGVSGLVVGLIMAPVLIIYGTLICLMVGPWMALGIPMIVAGICAPIVGPFIAISAVRGKCPWCGTKIASVGPLDAFYCYACSKRIEIRKRELVRAE